MTPVYTCLLDASKAFDRVNQWTWFTKLIQTDPLLLLVRVHHDYYTRVRRPLHVTVGKTASDVKTFRFCSIKIWSYIEAKIIIDISFHLSNIQKKSFDVH